jgi:hypothetical protein
VRPDRTRCRDRDPRARACKGWFGRERAPAGLALTFECELGYTFDPTFWGEGFATEAACCVRDYARDVLRLPYAVSAILPHNARSRRVAEGAGAHLAGQMDIMGRTFDRYVWPLANSGETLAPAGIHGTTTGVLHAR